MENTVKKNTEKRIRRLIHNSDKQLRKLKNEPLTLLNAFSKVSNKAYKRALRDALEILREETYIQELLNE